VRLFDTKSISLPDVLKSILFSMKIYSGGKFSGFLGRLLVFKLYCYRNGCYAIMLRY